MTQKFTQQVGRNLERSGKRNASKRKFYSKIPKLKRGRKNKAWRTNVSFNYGARNKGKGFTQPLAFNTRVPPKLRLSGGHIMVTIRLHKIGVSYTYRLGDDEGRKEARAKALGQYVARKKKMQGLGSDEEHVEDEVTPETEETPEEGGQELSPLRTGTQKLLNRADAKKVAQASRIKLLHSFGKFIKSLKSKPATPEQTKVAAQAASDLSANRANIGANVHSALSEHRDDVAKAANIVKSSLADLKKLPSNIEGKSKALASAVGKLRQRSLARIHEAASSIAKMINRSPALSKTLASAGAAHPKLPEILGHKAKLLGPALSHALNSTASRPDGLPPKQEVRPKKASSFDTKPAFTATVSAAIDEQGDDFLRMLEGMIVDLMSDVRPHDIVLADALSSEGLKTAYTMQAGQLMSEVLERK